MTSATSINVNIYELYLIYSISISIIQIKNDIKGYKRLINIANFLMANLVAPNIRKVENILLFFENIYELDIAEYSIPIIRIPMNKAYIENSLKKGILSFNSISYFHTKLNIEVIAISCDNEINITIEKTILPFISFEAYPIVELYTIKTFYFYLTYRQYLCKNYYTSLFQYRYYL